jgi:hypothetical protein
LSRHGVSRRRTNDYGSRGWGFESSWAHEAQGLNSLRNTGGCEKWVCTPRDPPASPLEFPHQLPHHRPPAQLPFRCRSRCRLSVPRVAPQFGPAAAVEIDSRASTASQHTLRSRRLLAPLLALGTRSPSDPPALSNSSNLGLPCNRRNAWRSIGCSASVCRTGRTEHPADGASALDRTRPAQSFSLCCRVWVQGGEGCAGAAARCGWHGWS